ncbi:MAG: hypothetical protein GXO18_04300 [Aquificae bacterium]|nr:hypothetical protein [Aquificota bacterium]
MLSRLAFAVHMVVASFLAFLVHPLIFFGLIPAFPPLQDLLMLAEVIALGLGFLVSYAYFRVFRVDNPKHKALIAMIVGMVLFWGSCFALICALAPALTNM